MDYFHIMAMQRPRVLKRLVRRLRNHTGCVLLDLEDAFWDADDPDATRAVRSEAREWLAELVLASPELFADQRIGIRINSYGKADYELDLQLLQEICRHVRPDCVWVSKMADPQSVTNSVEDLSGLVGSPSRVVGMLETRAGMQDMQAILEAARQAGMRWIVYGHYDYSLDSGQWPFLEVDDVDYWNLVRPLIFAVESAGLQFICPATFQLSNRELNLFLAGMLHHACRRRFGMSSLGMVQTAVFEELRRGTTPYPARETLNPQPNRALDEGELLKMAHETCATYLANKHQAKSFALDVQRGMFLSAHKYHAARNYIERREIRDERLRTTAAQ